MITKTDLPPRFIADAMLGKLTKWLRILGYDVTYERKIEDAVLIEHAQAENRLILTRDTHLLHRRWFPLVTFILIEHDHLPQQLRQIVGELKLSIKNRLFTRCVECNAPLLLMSRDDVHGIVPDYVYQTQFQFSQCPQCRRIYWPGTHWERTQERLQTFFPELEESAHG